ncbi:hypothetical protein BGAL_0168g00080 [Botrytis galanthina]|uniref:Uncharacterized protein n=1 Tax=Botrytis galanthina TaxID=278940 RepID=A0A4V4HUN0_9HELO|nr:hypothetical protein BGAL_0168g00080 [Botrytis galanthina]
MSGSVKVLISKHDMRDYRGAQVKRITVTAIEYINGDDRYLNPMIYLDSEYPSKQLDNVPYPKMAIYCYDHTIASQYPRSLA